MAVPEQIQHAFGDWDERDRPVQASVEWQRDRWLQQFPQLAAIFDALPDRLDRQSVRAIVSGASTTAGGMFEAMVAVYAWGWSMTRVGVPRARRVLQADPETVGSRLLAARTRLHEEGPLAGYWALARESRVFGLGPSFGTKFLYFVYTQHQRALILDGLVADWLSDHLGVVLASTRWVRRDYRRYLELMDAWSGELHIAAHVLEEIVFTNEATRRGLPGWSQASPPTTGGFVERTGPNGA